MVLFAIIAFASCEKDGDKLYLSPLEDTDLIATSQNVRLSSDQAKQVVLSFAWTGQSLTVNDPNYSVPNILTTTMLVSTSEDLTNAIESHETSTSKAYTTQELNTLTKNLGLDPDVATPLYFCVKYAVSQNTAPVYSNVVEVNITPYFIDMRYANLLDANQDDMDKTFFSENEDGIYKGFMGAAAWSNYYLKEGDGTLWGNVGEGGKEFFLSSDDTDGARWNMWYPGMTGCYYSTVNTGKQVWSTIYIPTLTISGDLEGEMTYDRPNNRWIYIFSTDKSGLSVTIKGTGKEYNTLTACDDELAEDKNVGFSGDSQNLEFGENALEIYVQVTESGEQTLVLDLNAADAFTLYTESGATAPEEVSWALWISGQDDGFEGGSWNFDSYLRLYNEDSKAYSGVFNINSQWGYKFYTEPDWGANILGKDEGNSESGSLKEWGDNIDAPEPGIYMVNASLSAMNYQTYKIEEVTVEGLNDNWGISYPMTETETPGVYTMTAEINNGCGWGFQFLINWNWDLVYGGSDGTLYFKGDNVKYDDSMIGGTYTFTLDLINGTYSIQ